MREISVRKSKRRAISVRHYEYTSKRGNARFLQKFQSDLRRDFAGIQQIFVRGYLLPSVRDGIRYAMGRVPPERSWRRMHANPDRDGSADSCARI